MLLRTDPGGWQFGLLVLAVAGVGLVSYWVYRDAAARGMDDAPYWGGAVGVASVVGVIVGGIVAVGVYLSVRPDAYAGGERPFDAIQGDERGDSERATDRAHADLPPVPELTAERVEHASETTLRGYARRYDRLDATGDPETIRAALAELVAAGETDRLGETVESTAAEAPDPNADHRRHLGRPRLRSERERSAGETGVAGIADEGTSEAAGPVDAGGPTDADGTAEADADRGFEWVEEA